MKSNSTLRIISSLITATIDIQIVIWSSRIMRNLAEAAWKQFTLADHDDLTHVVRPAIPILFF